ncbi:porin family protein [uncultured Rikenella sp.]|uniref:porin family protein n=1 Tax=uncultured Rikenella sp. TaxID=368003 RepID=UPI00262336C3|nr:porin family protein [uncultured Rikenella sp.]
MMKKTLLSICFCVAALSGVHAASPVQFGVKGGLLINSSDLKYTFSSADRDRYSESSTKPGFEIGLQARVRLPLGFLIQPEVVYSRTSGSFPVETKAADGTVTNDKLKVRSNWIEVPVLVGWKFSIVRLMAGPSFRFPMDEVMNVGLKETKVAPRLDNFVMGYQAGVGVDLGRLTIDARYCGNFSKIANQQRGAEDYISGLKVKEQKVAISIGYMILK